jgi:peroxiredoxin
MTSDRTFPHKLKEKEVIPAFSLPSSLGREINLWEYKHKQNLIIVFHHGPTCTICQRKLKEYAETYEKVKDLEAQILAISFDALDHLKKFFQSTLAIFSAFRCLRKSC